ncbi:MAG TPA: hypothetical protein CFH79_03200 [Sulfurospirillum sp. UBA11407]|jgi:hypothetical protein|nr:MAG TPA: hypothetical protein CFH79_03200 [Sulfurospirillum sp. UBA11407]DAB35032.1 MAG TPA: hypothetical protein CFH82_02385 [Sulfurospirillum sp. UBA12182]
MKKIVLFSILLFAINANALSWSQLKSWMNKTIEPDVKYNIETEGYNVRVYEFTPLTDPGATCIMTFTNEKMGMYCFPKTDKAIVKTK